MVSDIEFLVGILERGDPPVVAPEDFDSTHGAALRLWQQMGFIDTAPSPNPAPSCPYCFEGVPYRIGEQHICSRCCSTVDERHLFVWQVRLEHFLHWLAAAWKVSGGVRQIDPCLWQLGARVSEGNSCECFFWRGGILSEHGRARLARYRNMIVLYGISRPLLSEEIRGSVVSLLEGLRLNESLAAMSWTGLLQKGGNVRFDAHSGALWASGTCLGEVPFGSREYFFLRHLATHLDHVVAYADLKHAVLRQTGSKDTTDEASFCQDLKRRIKKRIPGIDQLMMATNKGEGYRLRGYVEV